MDCGNDKSILGLNSNSNWFKRINDCIKEWLYQGMIVSRNEFFGWSSLFFLKNV